MDKFTLHKHFKDQQQVRMWGNLVAFCGLREGMPVCFLAGKMDKLTPDEKADVLDFVQRQVGAIKRTPQTREAFDVLDARTDPSSG